MDFTKTVMGLELGSTRIKAVLVDEHHVPVASGSYDWENRLENGVWTYSLSDIHTGVQACFCRAAGRCAGKISRTAHKRGGYGRIGHDARVHAV